MHSSKPGFFHPLNPQKYVGDVKNIYYRSQLELKLLMWLDRHPHILKYSVEPFQIPYFWETDRRWHNYTPDVLVKQMGIGGKEEVVLIEVKPDKQTRPPKRPPAGKKPSKNFLTETVTWRKNNAKWKAAQAYCEQRNWRFQIITDKELNVRYSK